MQPIGAAALWARRARGLWVAVLGVCIVGCTQELRAERRAASARQNSVSLGSSAAPEPAASVTPSRSERVTLRGKSGRPVPLHPGDRERKVSARLVDGSSVLVLERAATSGWLRVKSDDGVVGWVSPRYVQHGKPGPEAKTGVAIPTGSPWHSRAECLRLVRSKQLKPRPAGRARVGTWNVRWFPEGSLGPGKHGEQPTDVQWLACAITWLQVDVLAVQEFLQTPRGKRQTTALLSQLDALSGGRWRAQLDQCAAGNQHVGFLYDESRVRVRAVKQAKALNPAGPDACSRKLRPGLGAYVEFPGGLDAHLVSVHLKSGTAAPSYALRRKSVVALDVAYTERQGLVNDTDVIWLGDFNTMGCPGCAPARSARDERVSLAAELGGLRVPLRDVTADLPCTEYYRGSGGVLDHVAVTQVTTELDATAQALVEGYCRALSCRSVPGSAMPEAYRALSDHCPVLLDLADRDAD